MRIASGSCQTQHFGGMSDRATASSGRQTLRCSAVAPRQAIHTATGLATSSPFAASVLRGTDRTMFKTTKTPEPTVLSVIRSNRRELRNRGLTAADILFLESLAFVTAQRRARSVGIAAVGRLIGVSRQAAHQRSLRLEAAGAVFRVGGALMLNVRGLLAWTASAVKSRLEAVRRAFQRKKERSVKHLLTHRGLDKNPSTNMFTDPLLAVVGTVAENLAALKSAYVPVHLRGIRT